MSIKGKLQELFVQKEGILLRDWFYNKKVIPYETISRIDYCFPVGIEGGWIDFINFTGRKHRFCFSQKSSEPVTRALAYFRQNVPDIKLIEKTPANYPFYFHKWFILLSIFLCCAPIGLILLWYSPLQRKSLKVWCTALWIGIFSFGIFSYYTAIHSITESLSTIMEPSYQPESRIETLEAESSANSATELFSDTLTAGHYTVGVDIPSGTYKFFAKSGFGNIFSESLAVNEIFDTGTAAGEILSGMASDELHNIELKDGDILSITGTLEISAGCDSAGETTSRNQDLTEIELGYGIYAAGDDFPAGTYNIIWLEGFGNVQTEPYDNNTGINEIFGKKLGEDDNSYVDFSETYDDINDIMILSEFQNVFFQENDLLRIGDIKVKLVPSD